MQVNINGASAKRKLRMIMASCPQTLNYVKVLKIMWINVNFCPRIWKCNEELQRSRLIGKKDGGHISRLCCV